MKPKLSLAVTLVALLAASGVNAAETGAPQYVNLETETAPSNAEIQSRRDLIEATAPISAAEKLRLKLEAAENRPGPEQQPSS